ncbi:MAG TPA: bifunctional (p)ppGpp synthetase/guanosine-3',5'-bis(diphosphate) 3'-pyrophosphohydrolase [Armatimonadota bacterium]|jgi:GTP pyrophosphokinase
MAADIVAINQQLTSYWPGTDQAFLEQVYEFAEEAHRGQKRATGEPYIIHPLEVALLLTSIQADPATLAAALLHDTVEDTGVTLEEISRRFGPTVADLVDGVTKLGKLDFTSKQEEQARNLRKMLLAMAEDIRVLIIKLADRLHNLQTLDSLTPARQKAIANETLHIYAPLAHRLGIWRFKWHLEDLSLKYLDPPGFFDIADKLGSTRAERENLTEHARQILERQLSQAGIKATVFGRAKHIYSIYNKIREQQVDFSEIGDLVALRVVTDTVADCYAALGLAHSLWMPLPGMFTDYIAMPKPNGYQSLHTKVMGPGGQLMEVQIRTWEMHRTAEYGVAAHWSYKEGRTDAKLDRQVSWLRQILELETDVKESHEFLELLQLDLFKDQVFVFTPDGDVIDLPAGAGPIDFAYRVHSEVGHHCIGARVNGRPVPLDYKFSNGDICEIVTSEKAQPSRDWLKLIQSSRAKAKVRRYLREQMREENVRHGRELIESAVRHQPEAVRSTWNAARLEEIAQHMYYRHADDLLAAIGYGDVEPSTLIKHLISRYQPRRTLSEEVRLMLPLEEEAPTSRPLAVSATGIAGLESHLSRCCSPLPGDPIMGYITRGTGIAVHRADCKNLQFRARKEPERVMPLTWGEQSASGLGRATVEVVATDRVGLLSHLTAIVADADVNITGATVEADSGHFARLLLNLSVRDREQLDRVMSRLSQLLDVVSVRLLKNP